MNLIQERVGAAAEGETIIGEASAGATVGEDQGCLMMDVGLGLLKDEGLGLKVEDGLELEVGGNDLKDESAKQGELEGSKKGRKKIGNGIPVFPTESADNATGE
ncbi:hypothetical protein MLD38_032786 [Melastoma candidum]|uniref:Uncharacterized protein n=1 Tax=Melastoma candidum TaxID=119954 RepID=A0ACB9M4R6_9MYRT|nr:hypothetical protein MLD38_032786 [Melastoma candidum]